MFRLPALWEPLQGKWPGPCSFCAKHTHAADRRSTGTLCTTAASRHPSYRSVRPSNWRAEPCRLTSSPLSPSDFYESGRSGRRIRKKGFATKPAAIRYKQDFFAALGDTGRPLNERLSNLMTVWYDLHGRTLRDDEEVLVRCQALAERLGDLQAFKFDSLAWTLPATSSDRGEAGDGQPQTALPVGHLLRADPPRLMA